MNPTLLFALIFLLGIVTHVMVRLYAPWPPRHQNFFWLATFGPIIVGPLAGAPDSIMNYIVFPLLGGVLLSEFTRPKVNAIRQHWADMANGKKPSPPPNTTRSTKKPPTKHQP